MDLLPYLKSVLDQDRAPVVVCDLDHTIIYMNPAAGAEYAHSGGMELMGKSLLDCHNARSNDLIKKAVAWFAQSREHNLLHTFYNERKNEDIYMTALRDESGALIGYYEKHEYRDRETGALYDFKP